MWPGYIFLGACWHLAMTSIFHGNSLQVFLLRMYCKTKDELIGEAPLQMTYWDHIFASCCGGIKVYDLEKWLQTTYTSIFANFIDPIATDTTFFRSIFNMFYNTTRRECYYSMLLSSLHKCGCGYCFVDFVWTKWMSIHEAFWVVKF